MKFSELVKVIADRSKIPIEHVSGTIQGLKDVVRETVAKEEAEIDLGRDFGKLGSYRSVATRRVAPSTGKSVNVPPRLRLRFVPSQAVRTLMNSEGEDVPASIEMIKTGKKAGTKSLPPRSRVRKPRETVKKVVLAKKKAAKK